MKYKHVFFDFDGTLADTISGITFACNKVSEIYNVEKRFTDAQVMTFIGEGSKRLFLRAFDFEDLDLAKYFDKFCGATLDGKINEKIDVMKYTLESLGVKDYKTVLMIGDRKYDINASNELGIDSVGVLYGFGNREEFEASNAKYIVENALDILEIVK